MTTQQLNAPARTSSPHPRVVRPGAAPRSGVVHVKFRHRERFTVVGNHLAQHRDLSLLAIGLAVHIQSVPDGTKVDIKSLTARFPEGEARIAAALRELEAYGYLARVAKRSPSGRLVTHTVSYDNPDPEMAHTPHTPPHTPPHTLPRAPEQHPPQQQLPRKPKPTPTPTATAPAPAPTPTPTPPERRPLPPLPAPRRPDPVRQAALRRDDARLLLSERDVARLSPAVDAWLERGTDIESVRRTLTTHLPPGPLHSPAALLSHRLTALLPPPLPTTPPSPSPPRPHPFQECPDCERPFRAPAPGRCRDCRQEQDDKPAAPDGSA
jgi:hypothetical protein